MRLIDEKLAYAVIQLGVAAKAGVGCDEANPAGTKVDRMWIKFML